MIGTLRAVDPETPSCTFKFADGSVTDGTFVIDGNQLKILDGAKLNYEAMPNGQKFLNIVLIAVDGAGAELAPQTFTINVTNAPSEPNAAPDNPVLLTDTINETAQIGDIVGLLGATDQDGDIVHFKFADGDADPGSAGLISWDGAFRINEFGQIVVHNPAKIQVTGGATSKTFTYNVVGNDGNNGATAGPVSIIVNNISVPPSQPSAGDGTIQDTAPIGAYVATLFSTDPDGGPVTFWFKWGDGSLHDTSEDGGRFKIAGTQIVVNGSIAVDHTTGFRYDIVAKDFAEYPLRRDQSRYHRRKPPARRECRPVHIDRNGEHHDDGSRRPARHLPRSHDHRRQRERHRRDLFRYEKGQALFQRDGGYRWHVHGAGNGCTGDAGDPAGPHRRCPRAAERAYRRRRGLVLHNHCR